MFTLYWNISGGATFPKNVAFDLGQFRDAEPEPRSDHDASNSAIQLFTRKERQGSWRCRFVSREVFLFVLTRAELPCEIPDGHIDPASLF
jgi:hypothetical protein